MNNHDASTLVERALSTTRALINSREQLTDNDVESLLFQIQSLLLSVDIDNQPNSNIAAEKRTGNTNLSDEIFDATLLAGKIKHTTQLYLQGCFGPDDADNTQCVMTAVISDFANELFNRLRQLENTFC